MIRNRKLALAATCVVLLGALLAGVAALALGEREREERPDLALMTTLPIYWGESASIAEALSNEEPPHWARALLERTYDLVPLDTLSAEKLARFSNLILAQPRALSGAENVALDEWVRGGGHLLLFADPMLTEHSRFAIGDRRRPQDVVLLSPILGRWGLELRFDEAQPRAQRPVDVNGSPVPVHLAGHFAASPVSPAAPSDCHIANGGLIASCRIGRGHALIVADAALLESDREGFEAAAGLATLAERAFP